MQASPWRTAIVVASGPSLTAEQCALIEAARERAAARVLVVNATFRALPNADAMYACDVAFWRAYIAEIDRAFPGQLWTCDEKARDELGICWIKLARARGLSRDPLAIHSGGNSGYQAINLAYNWGARQIILAGYDMQRTGGKAHWHGDHPKPLGNATRPENWIRHFTDLADDLVAEGVDVINCSAATALTQFRRADLAETLATL